MKIRERPNAGMKRTLEVSGRVVAVEPGACRVRAGSRLLVARPAASCLLAPVVDDEVTLVLLTDGRAYVTAVLERTRVAPSILALPGDATISAGGTLTIAAREAHTFAERVVVCARSSLRVVEGVDQAEVGELDVTARAGARVHARELLLTADALVKLDSDQVHVG